MVVAMMIRPPQGTALNGRTCPYGEQELAKAGRAIRLVGEVAMEDASDGEHPNHVEKEGSPHGEPAPPDPDGPEAAQMEDDEWNAADEVNAVRLGANRFGRLDGVVGVDPLDEGAEEATHSVEVMAVSDETSRAGKFPTIFSASRVSLKIAIWNRATGK